MTGTDSQTPRTPHPAQPGEPQQRKRLSTSAKVALITIPTVFAGALILFIVLALGKAGSSPAGDGSDPAGEPGAKPAVPLVTENSHLLADAGKDAPVLVEFLDFECEACREIYPVMEDVREEYADQVSFVVRYFPIPAHKNSMNAAIAVEAAAQQGKFEQMYQRMFETQLEWGERQESEAPRFRGFAEALGLDMGAYDAAVADPATQERVEFDFEQGQQLGVQGTPTFFLEGKLFQPQYVNDITEALDAAIAARK
ncbi:DsbA family protein [Leucobacter komagatae]|uniref:DsbA family protein n=1 Tax=Leucobacter komagatae TaxID=55969 RepID=UPI000A009245|nr:thioredoxin domain-containing protein [Leucobacter komagatae]